MGIGTHGYNANVNLPQHTKQMKQENKILTVLKFTVLFPLFVYLFIADRIMIFLAPFVKNKWHENLAMNHDKQWIALFTLYRLIALLTYFSIYKFITYVF